MSSDLMNAATLMRSVAKSLCNVTKALFPILCKTKLNAFAGVPVLYEVHNIFCNAIRWRDTAIKFRVWEGITANYQQRRTFKNQCTGRIRITFINLQTDVKWLIHFEDTTLRFGPKSFTIVTFTVSLLTTAVTLHTIIIFQITGHICFHFKQRQHRQHTVNKSLQTRQIIHKPISPAKRDEWKRINTFRIHAPKRRNPVRP